MSSTKSEASKVSTQNFSEDFRRPLTPLLPPLTLNFSLLEDNKRRAGLASEREAISIDQNLDEEAEQNSERELVLLSSERTRRRFSLSIFLSALLSAR